MATDVDGHIFENQYHCRYILKQKRCNYCSDVDGVLYDHDDDKDEVDGFSNGNRQPMHI